MIITCKLYGRLGNQLFQMMTAIAYSLRHNIQYCIPKFITCPPGLPTDPIYFNHFPHAGNLDINLLPVFNESEDQKYKEIDPMLKSANFVINGYFQSEKYFLDERQQILKIINLAFGAEKQYRQLTSLSGKVSIHVRRGDYLNEDKLDKHPVMPMSYYERAIDFMNSMGYYDFVLFSDEIDWCKQQFTSNNFPHSRFIFLQGYPAMTDMLHMSMCDHNIIANSSFSWWGAWLNENLNKVVVCPHPDKWYGTALSHVNTSDLLPEKWIRT